MSKYRKGFTLIELLVVIAIIGILSGVVLASLNSARSKGADAAIKGQLASIRAQAELVYDNGGHYGVGFSTTGGTTAACPTATGNNLFATTTILSQIASAKSASGVDPVCVTDVTSTDPAQKWAVAARLKSNTTLGWCVDSTGASKQVLWSAVDADAINTVCP